MSEKKSRARGCLLGLFVGDAIGAQYEFMREEDLKKIEIPSLEVMTSGGPHNLLRGQITDDSEMALTLARSIIENNGYSPKEALKWYKRWASSEPFDVGYTIGNALYSGYRDKNSQSNGALMRLAPIAILEAGKDFDIVSKVATMDSQITHDNIVVDSVNAIMASAMAYVIEMGCSAIETYQYMVDISERINAPDIVKDILKKAKEEEPEDCYSKQGWVLIAFQLAVYNMLNTNSAADSIINAIKRGGDTDTNGAISGMLSGSVFSLDSIPSKWIDIVLSCNPDSSSPNPRDRIWWTEDAFDIVDNLLYLNSIS